ncbi:hypothetical protein ACU4GI_20235 [Cupriavidus basilensis]
MGVPDNQELIVTLLRQRQHAARNGQAMESVSVLDVDLPLPVADDVLDRLDLAINRTESQHFDGRQRRQALDLISQFTESAIASLRVDASTPLSGNEICALEAIIRADGTRPSLLIQHGEVDVGHPFAAPWIDTLIATRARVGRIAAATGRVQPTGGTNANYYGTCFLYDATLGRAVTNRHVGAALLRASRTLAERAVPHANGRALFHKIRDGVEVDFAAEAGSGHRHPVAVTGVLLPKAEGVGQYATMDIAVLTLAPSLDGSPLPDAVPLTSDAISEGGADRGLSGGQSSGTGRGSICIVGFSGAPIHRKGVIDGVDWQWVDQQLFSETYGVKRLAPGMVHRSRGTMAGDTRGWVFGHDASTLGGNSGSGVFAWLDGGHAFGLHFAGTSAEQNCAHGFAMPDAREVMQVLDIPLAEAAV